MFRGERHDLATFIFCSGGKVITSYWEMALTKTATFLLSLKLFEEEMWWLFLLAPLTVSPLQNVAKFLHGVEMIKGNLGCRTAIPRIFRPKLQ